MNRARLAKAARETSAYRWTRSKVVRWLRRSKAGRRLARAAGYGGRTRGGWLPVTGGNGVPEDLMANSEPVLVIAVGAAMDEMTRLLEALQTWQITHGSVRPVLVVTGESMRAVRQFGYPVECLVSEGEWTSERSWVNYVRGHVARIRKTYGISWSLLLKGPSELAM